jgi:acyl-CoA oxidase
MFDDGMVTKSFLHYFLYTKSLIMFQNNPKHQ